MPLSVAKTGRPLRLVRIDGCKKMAHRLTELGLTPGVILTIIHNAGGPLLIAVRGSRVALGHDLVQRIQVQAAA